jgi:hypothetical protein
MMSEHASEAKGTAATREETSACASGGGGQSGDTDRSRPTSARCLNSLGVSPTWPLKSVLKVVFELKPDS